MHFLRVGVPEQPQGSVDVCILRHVPTVCLRSESPQQAVPYITWSVQPDSPPECIYKLYLPTKSAEALVVEVCPGGRRNYISAQRGGAGPRLRRKDLEKSHDQGRKGHPF